ncbi:MAG TPA: hypothetical protein VGQ83_38445 [Polyangia bacterium]|jgi:hypothetical protein
MRKTIINILGVVALASVLGGCAGARGTLAFDQLKFPVSSSAFIYAPDERPVTVNELVRVGRVQWVERIWGIFWSWIPLSGVKDVSFPINAQIAAAGGEGVINLAIKAENCGMNYVPFINWLPIYPGCTYVTITGDVVKLAAAAPVPPPPGAAPPVSFIPKDKVLGVVTSNLNKLLAAR